MCVCDTGYSGDRFNCTDIQLVLLPIEKYDTAHLHIKYVKKATDMQFTMVFL